MPRAPDQHKLPSAAQKHATSKRHRPRDHRGSARDRGYSTVWDKFSRAFLLSNPLCEFCLTKGITKPARVTDHDLPHRQDPDLFWDNTFTALCHSCHNGTKQALEARYDGDELLSAISRRKPVHQRTE